MSEQSLSALMSARNELAAAAQTVYDRWVQDSEGIDEEYGGGGICHEIADSMVEVLERRGIESQSVSQSIGEVHVYVVAKIKEGVYVVDIPPSTYERGSAYTWTKIPGVQFGPEDIDISRIDTNPEKFEDYIESRQPTFREWLKENCEPFIVRRSWPFLSGGGEAPLDRPVSRRGRRGRRR